MEAKVNELQTRIVEMKEALHHQRVEMVELRVKQDRMHEDFQQLIGKLDQIHETIKPLSEWSSKSKGALAVIGTIVTLMFVIIGAFVSAAFSSWFKT